MVTPPQPDFWGRSPNFGDPPPNEILGEVTGDPPPPGGGPGDPPPQKFWGRSPPKGDPPQNGGELLYKTETLWDTRQSVMLLYKTETLWDTCTFTFGSFPRA